MDEMDVEPRTEDEQALHPARDWANLSAAVRANPRRVIVVMIALAVPYLLICTGIAAMIFLTGAGGCG